MYISKLFFFPFFSQSSKIRAIENKLKMMEQKSDLDSFLFEPAIKKPKVESGKSNLM